VGDTPPRLVANGEVPRVAPPGVEQRAPEHHGQQLHAQRDPGDPQRQTEPPVLDGRILSDVIDERPLQDGVDGHGAEPKRMGTISE
jgi:hypothetical protein